MGEIGTPSSVDAALALSETLKNIDNLRPKLRAAIVAVGIHGLKYGEAAEQLGVGEGTVKSRVNRARARLAELSDASLKDGDNDGLKKPTDQDVDS